MRIGIIGKGRLGRSLASLLAPNSSVRLYGRQEWPDEPVILLAVPDAAIPNVAQLLPIGPLILHCSGAAPVDALLPHVRRGRLHPLMTFPGARVSLPDLTGVPAAVSGTDEAICCAKAIACMLGMTPIVLQGDTRLYHAAAVIAGNLTSLLLNLGGRIMEAAGVASREDAMTLLLPLVLASAQNAARAPQQSLTGPMARGDHKTIADHKDALREAGLIKIETFYEAANTLLSEIK